MPFTTDLSTVAKIITAYEDRSALRLVCGESAILTIEYPDRTHLRVLDGTGRLLGETDKSDVDEAGYFTLYMEALGREATSTMSYSRTSARKEKRQSRRRKRVELTTPRGQRPMRWDARPQTTGQRATPMKTAMSDCFYFLCWVGAGQHVQDNTKLYLDGGIDGVKGFSPRVGRRGVLGGAVLRLLPQHRFVGLSQARLYAEGGRRGFHIPGHFQ